MFDLTPTGANARPVVPAEPPRGRVEAPIGDLESGPDWRRAFAALRRHIWAILVVTGIAGVAGWYASRLILPLYVAHASVWIDEGNQRNDRSPLAPSDLFDAQGWVELMTSNTFAPFPNRQSPTTLLMAQRIRLCSPLYPPT